MLAVKPTLAARAFITLAPSIEAAAQRLPQLATDLLLATMIA